LGTAVGTKQYRAHVELVDGVERTVKFCVGCGLTKVAEKDAPDSCFALAHGAKGRSPVFKRLCRPCDAARLKRLRADPVRGPKLRERELRARNNWLAKDPENVAKARAACRAWHHRAKAEDPQGMNETARMNYALRAEREGRPITRKRPTVIDRTRPVVPITPFRLWIEAVISVECWNMTELSAKIATPERRIRGVLAEETPNVSLDSVDRAIVSAWNVYEVEGRPIFTLDDLYPEAS
jgi:hypothetical protein